MNNQSYSHRWSSVGYPEINNQLCLTPYNAILIISCIGSGNVKFWSQIVFNHLLCFSMNICEYCMVYDCVAICCYCSCYCHVISSLPRIAYLCSVDLLLDLVLIIHHQHLVPLQEMSVRDQEHHPRTGHQHSVPCPLLLACVFCWPTSNRIQLTLSNQSPKMGLKILEQIYVSLCYF